MASWIDNITTIETAVYGKEMRPAIAEALMRNNGALTALAGSIEELKARVDALPGPGGGSSPDKPVDPDNPDQPITPTGCSIVGNVIICADGVLTDLVIAAEADPF